MRIAIIAVGRARAGPLADLFADYAERATATRVIGAVTLHEVEERRKLGPALKAREADLLRAAIPKGARIVALDAGGESLSSDSFARRLAAWRDSGTSTLAFLIGGAEGLDAALLREASARLSLGAMTWPHLLVRIMLAEQLYRAATILQGHPYHRA